MTTTLVLKRRRARFGNLPLRYKLLIGVLLSALLPLLIATTFTLLRYVDVMTEAQTLISETTRSGITTVRETVDEALAMIEEDTAPETRLMIQLYEHVSALASGVDAPTAYTLMTRTDIALQNTLINNYRYLAMRLLDAQGTMIADVGNTLSNPSIQATDQSQHPTYAQVAGRRLPTLRPVLVGPYADPESGGILMEVVVYIQEQGGTDILGYVVFTLEPEAMLQRPLSQLRNDVVLPQDQTLALYMVDEELNLLTSVGTEQPFSRRIDNPAALDGVAGHWGTLQYEATWAGETQWVLGGYAPVSPYPWAVVGELIMEPIVRPIVNLALLTIMPLVLTMALISSVVIYMFERQMIRPLRNLTFAARQVTEGNFGAEIPGHPYNDEIGQLSSSFATMTDNIRTSIETLERRVRERTRDLEMTNVIGREASMLRDVNTLLNETVDLIIENFKSVYHAQVFLIDEAGENAVLVASTGEPGRRLMARGHYLAVGSLSVIGRVTETGQVVVARHTSANPIHKKNEFLPNTQAEIALPLKHADQVLGALDMQSTNPEAFTSDEQHIFEVLANQLAVAVVNARLFTEAQRRAAEIEELNRLLTRRAWEQALITARRQGELRAEAGAVNGNADAESEWQREAMRQREAVISPVQPDGSTFLAVPIVLRGEALGVIEWKLPAGRGGDHARQLARELTGRLAVTMENIRLLEQSERMAIRERLVNQISGQLSVKSNVSQILETAVRELAQVLQTPQVSVHLKRPESTPESGPMESAS